MSSKVNIYEAEEERIAPILQREHALVLFGAIWCPHCRAMKPIIERVAAAHPALAVAQVDVDRAPTLASRFRVRGVPVTLYFESGEEKGRLVGFHKAQEVEMLITAAEQKVTN